MSGDPAATARHRFIDRLAKLRQDAGQPSLPALRRLSEKLAAPASGRRVLAESTTHDILTGKRRGLPSWPWVAAYVRACHAAAQQAELDPARLGSLGDWHGHWAAACDAARRRSDPIPLSAPLPPTRPATQQPACAIGTFPPPHPRGDPGPGGESPEFLAEFGPAAQRSETLNRYLRSFGMLGGRLLARAEGGDPAAAYRLGVLLWCEGRPQEGLAWLEQAADEGISDAAHLCDQRDLALIADCAYELGQASEQTGDTDAAHVYYLAAANCGHAEAAYQTGVELASAGDPWAAGYWLGKAARLGHPGADQHLDDIYDQIRGRTTGTADGPNATSGTLGRQAMSGTSGMPGTKGTSGTDGTTVIEPDEALPPLMP